MLQQAIREAAGGRADVETDSSCGIDVKIAQRAFQFEAAAAGIFLFAAVYFQQGILRDRRAGFGFARAVHRDFACEDHRLRFAGRVRQAARDQQIVEPRSSLPGFHGEARFKRGGEPEIRPARAVARHVRQKR